MHVYVHKVVMIGRGNDLFFNGKTLFKQIHLVTIHLYRNKNKLYSQFDENENVYIYIEYAFEIVVLEMSTLPADRDVTGIFFLFAEGNWFTYILQQVIRP